MALLFLSYRVATAAPHVGRLYDRLAVHFGEAAIFYDRGCLHPGDLWRERLQQELHGSAAVLPIVDPRWSASFAEHQDTEDMALFELETAVQLQKTIVPLRVGGAAIPTPDELPSTLWSIFDRQFFVIDETTPATYDASVATVISTLESIDGLLAAVESQAVDLLVAKNYVAAERLLVRQPSAARQRPTLSAYLALARLAGRSFNALYPAERDAIESLLRRAWAGALEWELPRLLLAIIEIDYYQLHGLVSAAPMRPTDVAHGPDRIDIKSRALLSNFHISPRARRELQLDALLSGPAQ
jgi:hypothetical protein